MKKILYNAGDRRGTLNALRVIKTVSFAAVIFFAGFSLEFMTDALSSFREEGLSGSLNGYSGLQFWDEKSGSANYGPEYRNERLNLIRTMESDLYCYGFDRYKPMVCVNILSDEAEYILANSRAEPLVRKFVNDEADKGSDITVYIPRSIDPDRALKLLPADVLYNEAASVDIRYYSDRRKLQYINPSSNLGVKTAFNPVLIYVRNENASKKLDVNGHAEGIAYLVSEQDVADIIRRYALDDKGFRLRVTDMTAFFEYHSSFFRKVFRLITSAVTVLLILQFFIQGIITAYDFRMEGMQISLEKISGYGFLRRHLFKMGFCIFTDMLMIMKSMGKMTAVESSGIVGLFMLLLDISVFIVCMVIIEKRSVVKVLKGGSL